ncbi:hypothetical protein CHH28_06350 [Bacterioplanes sanyensis]|uniref:TonB-dependent receptor n=1 Tax=Bacterioplanes sanyensis TaxID=1249553 RepID=A0A222FJC0_9GAMM|nr:TonB-dependent receptor [Bacterioplanes sanyensis]ASP38323.1 hypothetical protein CHH28_06350 [Bacterioplanes sanyensis]
MKGVTWRLWPLAVAAVIALPTQADDAFNLSHVVVTASRQEQPLADTPVRTQLLDRATIQRLHATDIRDALRVIPGIQLREIHGKTGEEVYMQGFNGDRVLILVDGMPVSATTGSTVDVSQLSALDIDHIEVIPGAASALYGSAAMGGVVNIITRQPQGNFTRLRADVGSYGERQVEQQDWPGERHLALSSGWRLGSVDTRLSGDWRQSDGYDLNDDTYSTDGYAGTKANIGVALLQRGDDGYWGLNLDHFFEDSELRRYTKGGAHGSKQEELSRWRASAELEQALAGGLWALTALHERQNDQADQLNNDASMPAGNLLRDTDYQQHKLSNQWSYTPSSWGGGLANVVMGVEWFGEQIEQHKRQISLTDSAGDNATVTPLASGLYRIDVNEVPLERRHNTEAFAQLTLPTSHWMEWSPGVRFQHDSDFGGHSSVNLAARSHIELGDWQLQWRNSIGTGYRVPNLKNRYYLFDHSINGYMVLGNAELEPEQSRSIQTSLSLTDGRRWQLELSAFHNQIRDLIEADDTGERIDQGQVAIYQYRNYARALTRGLELSTQQQLWAFLQQRLSYGFLDARDLSTDLPLINRARHHIKGMWLFDIANAWQLTLTADWQRGLYTTVNEAYQAQSPALLRWDVKGEYQFSEQFRLYGGINNLTDSVRDPGEPADRRPVYGRKPYLGVSLTF